MKISLRAFALIMVLAVVLSACAPKRLSPHVQNHVVPTLISVTHTEDGHLHLQGRYFADGANGAHPESAVHVGTDANGSGGVRADIVEWSSNSITVAIPRDAPHGFVAISVAGIPSNALPFTAPRR